MERNMYVDAFIDTLCRNRYDVDGNDLAQMRLEDLKYAAPQQYPEAKTFYDKVRYFEHLAMEEDIDINDEKNIKAANEYEKLVDNSAIQSENKAALYNTLLGFIDINGGSEQWYMNVLHKKINIIDNGRDFDLNLTAKQAFFHRHGATRSSYLNSMHLLYSKMQDKTKFTFLKEIGLGLDNNGKKIISLTKMSPQQRLERLSVIESVVKEPLPVDMRISLLEEGLKLANNNLRRRNENFKLKEEFCTQLQKDYTSLGQYAKANNYGLSAYNWKRSFNLALEHVER